MSKSKTLQDFISDIILYTEISVPDPNLKKVTNDSGTDYVKFGNKKATEYHQFPLKYIGAVEPIIQGLELHSDDTERRFFCDALPSDVGGEWDVSTLTKAGDSWTNDGGMFQLTRNRRVPLSELRGQKVYSAYVDECSVAVLKKDGTYESARSLSYFIGKDSHGFGRWIRPIYINKFLSRDSEYGDVGVTGTTLEEDEEHNRSTNMALGIKFTRDYDWGVSVSLANMGNPLWFATDPAGAKAVFADRDKAGLRREALKHWVEEHWRKKRTDPDFEVMVRRHMRGIEPFIWAGYNCRLSASPYDIRLCDKLERQRKELADAGKAVRLRQNNAAMVK